MVGLLLNGTQYARPKQWVSINGDSKKWWTYPDWMHINVHYFHTSINPFYIIYIRDVYSDVFIFFLVEIDCPMDSSTTVNQDKL